MHCSNGSEHCPADAGGTLEERKMKERRFVLSMVSLVAVAWYAPVANAWNGDSAHCSQTGGYLRFDPDVTTIEIRLAPGEENPRDGDALDWTSAEKAVLDIAAGTFNHLSTARLHIYRTNTACDHEATPAAGTICLWKKKSAGTSSNYTYWYYYNSCEVLKARISIDSGGTNSEPLLYRQAVHEIASVLGVRDTDNSYDWMSDYTSGNFGGPYEHLGMTRDTRNALSYLYPFGQAFYFGHFDESFNWTYPPDVYYSRSLTDVLVRDATAEGNTIPWRLFSRRDVGVNDSWHYLGEVSDDGDFGNENTLPYVVGQFTGSGGDDIAAGFCSSPDPGDGGGDTMQWYVMESISDYSVGFDTTNMWKSDFGNAEDFDGYYSGSFTGSEDECDDLLLVRNLSDYDCDPTYDECVVRLYVMPAQDDDSPPDGECDSFGSFYYYDVEVDERSATTAWPWVVGDFYTEDGLGCADIAFGNTSQTDPSKMYWYVVKGVDSDSDDICDSLSLVPGAWTGDMGDQGQLLWFAGDFGAPDSSVGQDLVRVKVTGTTASWYVAYSDGEDDFTNGHTPVSDMLVTSEASHFDGMIFHVGDFHGPYMANVDDDFLAIVDNTGEQNSMSLYAAVNQGGSPTPTWDVESADEVDNMPWDYATDLDDWNITKDNAGDDVRYDWWCSACDVWYNDTN